MTAFYNLISWKISGRSSIFILQHYALIIATHDQGVNYSVGVKEHENVYQKQQGV